MKYKKLGFSFYGYGNVGDDLMLDGFLDVWNNRAPLFCVVSRLQKEMLQRRFPNVLWITEDSKEPEYDVWIGVGDTPVQVLSGLGMLERLEEATAQEAEKGNRIVLVGIGCEHEALAEKSRFRRILCNASAISTRSGRDKHLLIDGFGVPELKVIQGEDLANISLKKIYNNDSDQIFQKRFYDLGLNFYRENSNLFENIQIRRWVSRLPTRFEYSYLSTEARAFYGSEYWNYLKLEWLFSKIYKCAPIYFNKTNEWASSITEQLPQFSLYKTIISSRYHCLLSAAWAGCKISAISRSSKIQEIGHCLGISISKQSITGEVLDEALKSASFVNRERLNSMADEAKEATAEAIKSCV